MDGQDRPLKEYDYLPASAATGDMFWIMCEANSLVLTFVAPSSMRSKSYVTFFCWIVCSNELSISCAASCQPMNWNIITPDSITDPGLMTSLSAYLGAVPCVASKMAC